MKYNSLSICGLKQARGFARLLSTNDDKNIPKVRHLLLKVQNRKPPLVARDDKDARQPFDHQRSRLGQTVVRAEDLLSFLSDVEAPDLSPKLFSYILFQLSPHLITLICVGRHLVYYDSPAPHFKGQFPCLRELTLYACDFFNIGSFKETIFPKLKYLYLAFSVQLAEFYPLAPSLIHLHVTTPGLADAQLIADLKSLVPVSRSDSRPSHAEVSMTRSRRNTSSFHHLERMAVLSDAHSDFLSNQFPSWLTDLHASDHNGLLDILECNMKSWGYRHPSGPEHLYKYEEVEDNWRKSVEGLGPY